MVKIHSIGAVIFCEGVRIVVDRITFSSTLLPCTIPIYHGRSVTRKLKPYNNNAIDMIPAISDIQALGALK